MSSSVHLELVEGNSSKFWEIAVKGKKTTVKYGKLGTGGQTQEKTHGSVQAAKDFMAKQIKAKKKKGYSECGAADDNDDDDEKEESDDDEPPAKKGKKTSEPKEIKCPILWKCEVGTTAYGIYIDDHKCMYGDENGNVVELDHQGNIKKKYKLDSGVKCIVGDGDFLYVGTNDGELYDLTQGVPRLMCQIEDFGEIFWLDVCQGVIAASDEQGNIAMVNCEGETVWRKKSKGDNGWMARMDDTGIYHGHTDGVTKYSLNNGKQLWHNGKGISDILFGVQSKDHVYPVCNGGIKKLKKSDGKQVIDYHSSSTPSNAVGGGYAFAVSWRVEVYDEAKGTYLYKMEDNYRSDMSAQFHNGKLYTVDSYFNCIDMSKTALQKAEKNSLPKTKTTKTNVAVEEVGVSETVEATSDASDGILVHCIKEGGKVRVRPLSSGYNASWNVQFPRAIRKEGKKFVVDELRISEAGGFYRAFGSIKEFNG